MNIRVDRAGSTDDGRSVGDVRKQGVIHAERERIATITSIGERHKLGEEARSAIESGMTVEDFGRIVLDKIEARQRAVGGARPAVDVVSGLTEKDRSQYSLARAIESVRERGRSCFEREISDSLRKEYGCSPRSDSSIFVPYDMLGRAVSVTTGTAQHTVPNVHGQYLPHLGNKLALVRAGMTVLTGLRGELDIPAGDVLGTAGMPGENASQADSEATFRQARLSPKPARSRATFSRTLLNNSTPSIDRVIEGVLTQRVEELIERQVFRGAGGSAEVTGIDGTAGVLDADFASNAVSYDAFLNMIASIDDAKAMVGDVSFITTMRVIAKGLGTARFGTSGFQPILSAAPGETDQWLLDGFRVFRSHEVSSSYPSPESPSQTIAHGIYAGVWSRAYLGLHGPGIEILADPFTNAETGAVILWVHADMSFGLPQPEVIARADNILLS